MSLLVAPVSSYGTSGSYTPVFGSTRWSILAIGFLVVLACCCACMCSTIKRKCWRIIGKQDMVDLEKEAENGTIDTAAAVINDMNDLRASGAVAANDNRDAAESEQDGFPKTM